MSPRDKQHILLRASARTEKYSPHLRGFSKDSPPSPPDRKAHASALKTAIESARDVAEKQRGELGFTVAGAVPGVYVQFESYPGFDLKLESLESTRSGIELMAVTEEADVQRATVFVPDGSIKHFVQRFEQYAMQQSPSGKPKHKDLVERIASLRLATLRALWTDMPDAYPWPGTIMWWEVWLRRHDGGEFGRLLEFAGRTQLQVAARRLEFDDRIVTLVYGTAEQLSASLEVLNDIAEVRKAKESAAVLSKMNGVEQGEWVKELLDRTVPPSGEAPAVCVLDTGVNRGHPLLEGAIMSVDLHACDPQWGTHDHLGHGTEMAGLALYGDLTPVLASSAPVHLRHRIESVKILPPKEDNPPDLYGAITAEAVARVEVQAPERRRSFSMAISAEDTRDRGQPTSWSAAIDALAAGRSFEPAQQGLVYLDGAEDEARRLFAVCAGNVDTLEVDHLNRSDLEPIRDPGQAWNALTIGAFTEQTEIDLEDETLQGWSPLAPPGELSPYSTTSVSFASQWPIKPDIVMEGGNKACPPGKKEAFQTDCLSLLTTHFKPGEKPLVVSWATSAATAQAARLAGIISAEYPSLWPETIRALIVHSAEWTPRMKQRLIAAQGKQARSALFRRYGFGVPSFERALRSASNALTLIVQDSFHPFTNGKFREMHIHELPWPGDVLASLGPLTVRLRVTLSYFVEPNPGRRGWKTRHRYASHGLRFDVKSPTESLEQFRKRLNKQALDEDEQRPDAGGDTADWFLGERARNKGSLHSDVWEGTAADLAERGCIGICPVSGWWKEQPKRDRSALGVRYALIVSIETEQADVDVWTPVAQQVGIPIEVET